MRCKIYGNYVKSTPDNVMVNIYLLLVWTTL